MPKNVNSGGNSGWGDSNPKAVVKDSSGNIAPDAFNEGNWTRISVNSLTDPAGRKSGVPGNAPLGKPQLVKGMSRISTKGLSNPKGGYGGGK